MRRQRRSLQLLALILGLSLIAAACGGDDDDDAGDAGNDEEEAQTQDGGEIVLGAEQEPDCMDWISICSGASWGFWTAQVNTMPRSFEIVKDGDEWVYEASSLLNGEPEIELEPAQVVTYSISDDAVWSDEEPIVCQDFVYTWDQIKNGPDMYDRTGFQDIESVDCTDDKTPVVTFATPYAGWKQLFGGQFGILPSHLLEGQDRAALMANGYDFSGGPWIIESWNKGTSIVLVPNENYWGTVPTLDKVTFNIISDTSASFEAFKGGETMGMYPQPQLDAIEQIADGIEGAESSVNSTSTPNAEALWINNAKAPFDTKEVRQAFAYALDRDAIVEALFGELGIDTAMNSFNATILGDFGDPDAFAGYSDRVVIAEVHTHEQIAVERQICRGLGPQGEAEPAIDLAANDACGDQFVFFYEDLKPGEDGARFLAGVLAEALEFVAGEDGSFDGRADVIGERGEVERDFGAADLE